jgi:hypothetical protein
MGQKHKEKIKQKPLRHKSKLRGLPSMIGIFVLLAVVLVFIYHYEGITKPAANPIVNPETLPGIQLSEAPWQPEISHLRERLNLIGLPALSEEGTTQHIHQHIDIAIQGKSVPVPAMIGVNRQERFISPVHTHDTKAVIHVESPTVQTFTLGQFFDIWGVRFSSKCLGSYCEDQQNSIKVFVNGEAAPGNPRFIELKDHQEIVITYGTPEELPDPIPSHYPFGPGS